MTNNRRRFSPVERAALFLAADGHCERCGRALEPGWHADHVTPHALDGPTDTVNGGALCPTCNLKKGVSEMDPLRDWQRHAVDLFLANNEPDFLVSATPGSGKTRLALYLANRLVSDETVERVVVVVPTDALRQQWADVAAELGLDLMPASDPADYDKVGYHGSVVTYAQVAGAGAAIVRRVTKRRTMAILDEIHHAGESQAWGDGLRHAFEHAVYRVALTGTPWRRDRAQPIPFVRYDETGKVVVDAGYEYGEAVADGVCRGVVFEAFDGRGRWTDGGVIAEANLGAELADDDVPAVLDAVYGPENEWIPTLLGEANRALDELREEAPDVGGLIVADTQWHARSYGNLLAKIAGEPPVVVVSADPGAKDAIDRFRTSRARWLVAVRMVSEGVDIPRLAVGVYASKVRTPLFFRQVVGRFVRTRPGEDLTARLFIPAVPDLMRHAREVEEELRHELELAAERAEKASAEVLGEQRTFELRESLSASAAVFDRSIYQGDDIGETELADAEAACRRHNISTTLRAQVARMLREHAPATHEVTVTPRPPTQPRHKLERMLRHEVEHLARRVARVEQCEPREVNGDLLRAGFPRRPAASLAQLEQMRDLLAGRLGGVE